MPHYPICNPIGAEQAEAAELELYRKRKSFFPKRKRRYEAGDNETEPTDDTLPEDQEPTEEQDEELQKAEDLQSGIDKADAPSRQKKAETKVEEKKAYAAQPSDAISPEKAKQILQDGEVKGHPLTEAQKGMFGAAAGRSD